MEQVKVNPWQWQNKMGFSQGVEVAQPKNILYCAGQASMDADGNAVHDGDMRAQIMQAMDNLERVLSEVDYSLSDVVRLNYYTTDVDEFFAAYADPDASPRVRCSASHASPFLSC